MEIFGYLIGAGLLVLAIRAWFVLGKISDYLTAANIELTNKRIDRNARL
ncbi:hypothetical protein [Ensifer sp. SL37]|nr:hypothetical protein [Ensifer sp. SL37]MCY1741464.1 hypothetical protein [Ensifer sp. SL37]